MNKHAPLSCEELLDSLLPDETSRNGLRVKSKMKNPEPAIG